MRSIGYLIPEQRTHKELSGYIRRLYTGIYDELNQNQVQIVSAIVPSGSDVIPEIVSLGAVDGVVIEDESDPRLVKSISDYVPTVLLNYYHRTVSVDSCMPDNAGGMRLAIQYLYDLGHRRIAMFGFNPHLLHHTERLAGYRQSLDDFDLPFREEYLAFHTPAQTFDTSQADEFSLKALERWMKLPEPPTAVLSVCDMHASFFLRAARMLGVAIPQQLSVIGFDNLSLCEHLEPRLTSLHQPMEDMGRYAARMLMESIAGEKRPVIHLRLGVNLVTRESTGPAPSV